MTSSSQPEGTGGPPLTPPYSALLLAGFTWHPVSPPDPVSSYLTLSPLPVETGGLLSVALSLGSPPLVVIQRPVLWSPDFPPPEGGDRLACSNQSVQETGFIQAYCFQAVVLLFCSRFLLQDKNPLAMGTEVHFIPLEQRVVELRRELHIATHAGTIPCLCQGLPPALVTQLGVTPYQAA